MRALTKSKSFFWVISLVFLFLISGLYSAETIKVQKRQDNQMNLSGKTLQSLRELQRLQTTSERLPNLQLLKQRDIQPGVQAQFQKELQQYQRRVNSALHSRRLFPLVNGSAIGEAYKSKRFESHSLYHSDGTPSFDGSTSSLNFLVNGVTSDTITVGDNPVFTFDFPEGADEAWFTFIWDANDNGVFDDGDIVIEDWELFDNDESDEDTTSGSYQLVLNDYNADGLNRVSASFIYELFVADTTEYTHLLWEPLNTDFAVSGSAFRGDDNSPIQGIVVIAFQEDSSESGDSWIDITDEQGEYSIYLPGGGDYVVLSFDYMQVTDGLVPDPGSYDVNVTGIMSGYDFTYIEPTSSIYGYVLGNDGTAIANVSVIAHLFEGEAEFTGTTDENGFYSISVPSGDYFVKIPAEDVAGSYLVQPGVEVYVGENDSTQVDFSLYPVDNTISGTVYYNDVPASGILVLGDHVPDFYEPYYGLTVTESGEDGSYTLYVYSGDNQQPANYFIHAIDLPEGVIQMEWLDFIPAGSADIDIHLIDVNGGLFGYFINSETGDTLYEMVGMSARNLDNGMEFFSGPDWETGMYELYLPDGLYEVLAGGEGFYLTEPDTVSITGTMIQYDFYLDPVEMNSSFSGVVFDTTTELPVIGALISVFNDQAYFEQVTDDSGQFHFDLPNGDWNVMIVHEGYFPFYDQIYLWDEDVYKTYFLTPMETQSVIYGHVTDGETNTPLSDVDLFLSDLGGILGLYEWTDEDGNFYFNVPNGCYMLSAYYDDYVSVFFDSLCVDNDSLYLDIVMWPADGHVYGQLTDATTGTPIPDGWIGIVDVNTQEWIYDFADYDGNYYVPLLNGTYIIHAVAPDYYPTPGDTFTIENNDVEINLQLQPFIYEGRPPEIMSITDVPNDQGRWVRIVFDAGYGPWGPFQGWSIWRVINDGYPVDQPDPGLPLEFVTYIPFHGDTLYSTIVHTLVDSNAYTADEGNYWSTFIVSGHFDFYNWMDSPPASGYSVDNIQPSVPGGFRVSTSDNTVLLEWDQIPDEDFSYYAIYRSETPGNYPDTPTFATIETSFQDANVEAGKTYYYVVQSFDANGNGSGFSEELVVNLTSVDFKASLPERFVLHKNFPNPFNPATEIRYELPKDAFVQMRVYDLTGRLVKTLVNADQVAGTYSVVWDGTDMNGNPVPSGVYLYVFSGGQEFQGQGKMILMK